MEWENCYGYGRRRSSGTAKAGLATGIVGTSLGALGVLGAGANGIGNWFGRNNQPVVVMENNGWDQSHCCSEDHFVNRYELELQQKLAEKDSQIALRDANTYNDQKMLEMYKYVDGRFREFEQALASQAVFNQKTSDDVQRVQANLDCCCSRLETAINFEAHERRCNDNTIVNYANNTFYAKMIADITTGTTTTRQAVYNPLGCCCDDNMYQNVVVTGGTPAAATA